MTHYRTIKTQRGLSLEVRADTGGKAISLVTMVIGDGGGAAVEPDGGQTALKNEVARFPLNALSQKDDDATQWVAEAIVPPESGGYTVREVGLLTDDGELFAVGNFPDVYKARPDEGTAGQLVITMNFQAQNSDNINLVIDGNSVVATRNWVQNFLENKVNRSGDTLSGTLFSSGTFKSGNLEMTQPIGAAFWGMQFFLQLANEDATGTTYGRLVLRDNGGNYFVALQIDNHGNVTDSQGRPFLSKPEADTVYLNKAEADATYLSKSEGRGQFLPLTGGTTSGDITLQGNVYNNRYYGRTLHSTVPQTPADARFQLLGSAGAEAAALSVVGSDNKIHAWNFNASNNVSTPSGNTLLEIGGSGTQLQQNFRVPHSSNSFWVSFPRSYRTTDGLCIQITPIWAGSGGPEASVPYVDSNTLSNTGFSLNASLSGAATEYFIAVTGQI